MTKEREALKLALEVLEQMEKADVWQVGNAIAAINKALAQPEQEPVAYSHKWDKSGERCVKCGDKDWMGGPCTVPDTPSQQRKPLTDDQIDSKELSSGLAMALHDAVLIRIGADDEATRQAIARIDKLVLKYKAEAAHGIKGEA